MTLWAIRALSIGSLSTLLALPSRASAETQAAPTTQAAPAVAAAAQGPDADDDDPAVLDVAEPDFVVINIPTTLRLPGHKSNFRLTHRFVGNLRAGTFSQNAGNLFGLDQGAVIGFEYRINVLRNLQAGVLRTSFDKTFQFSGKYDAIRQRGSMPVSMAALVSIEGSNNFQEKYQAGVGVVASRRIAQRLALYAAPIWVDHTNASLQAGHSHDGEESPEDDEHERQGTFFIGFGGRARLTSTVYVVGEVTPRLGGYAPDELQYGFGLEKRVGGHAFALTFTNSFGTTFAQIARGGAANSLYFGFNLGRKFY